MTDVNMREQSKTASVHVFDPLKNVVSAALLMLPVDIANIILIYSVNEFYYETLNRMIGLDWIVAFITARDIPDIGRLI